MSQELVLSAEARSDGVVTIHVAGVVDAHTLDRFEGALSKALDHGAKSFVLDCEELRYVNSSGFGELIRYHDRLKERDGVLVMARVPPKVAIILEMLGLKSLIPVVSSLAEGLKIAAAGGVAQPKPAVESGRRVARQAAPTPPAGGVRPAPEPNRMAEPSRVERQTVICAFCDTRVRICGPERTGRWACPGCGAPFTVAEGGGVAFDWSNADAEAIHLTLDVTPRTLAAAAGLIEGVLVERRVSHARMRRFAREAAQVCNLLAENVFSNTPSGPLHLLLLAGPQRLQIRIVDRGRALGEEAQRIFSTQSRLFLDFRYVTLADGVNVTEFAFAYAGSGVFVA